MFFTVPFNDVITGAVANAFKTIATIIVPDTAGQRVRVRSLNIGPSDDAPADRNYAVRVMRIADVSSGTAGSGATDILAQNLPKKDTSGPKPWNLADGTVVARVNYTVSEPTTFEANPLWQDDYNDRGGVIKEWDEDGAPRAVQDQLMAVQVAPRVNFTGQVSGCMEIEVY